MKKDSKNIKHVWSMLCQSSVIDQQTNNISLQNVLEQIQVNISSKAAEDFKKQNPTIEKGLPVTFNAQIASLWRSLNPKVTPSADVEIEFFDGIGDSLQKIEFKLVFEEGKGRMRSMINVPGLVITDTGLYLFKIKVKEEGESAFTEAGEIPLEIIVIKGE